MGGSKVRSNDQPQTAQRHPADADSRNGDPATYSAPFLAKIGTLDGGHIHVEAIPEDHILEREHCVQCCARFGGTCANGTAAPNDPAPAAYDASTAATSPGNPDYAHSPTPGLIGPTGPKAFPRPSGFDVA